MKCAHKQLEEIEKVMQELTDFSSLNASILSCIYINVLDYIIQYFFHK